jgi:hypothetical protein
MKVTKWIKFLDDNYKLTNYLDEIFDKSKCMDENHIYMDESYPINEIFG